MEIKELTAKIVEAKDVLNARFDALTKLVDQAPDGGTPVVHNQLVLIAHAMGTMNGLTRALAEDVEAGFIVSIGIPPPLEDIQENA